MLLGENIVLALRSLASNKMRAFLTMLGIIIGIASVIAIFTVGNSLTLSVSENMQSLGANDIYVSLAPRTDKDERDPDADTDGIFFGSLASGASLMNADEDDYITADMIHDMSKEFGSRIYAVNAQMQAGSGKISVLRETESVSVLGVSAGYFITNQVDIVAGSMFHGKDLSGRQKVCLMDKSTAEGLYGDAEEAVGKEIEVSIGGQSQEFEVLGVYENNNSSSQYMMFQGKSLYIPLKTAADISHKTESFQYVQVIAGVGEDTDQLSKDLTNFFMPLYRSNTEYKVTALTLEGMVKMLDQLLGTITTAISIIAGISLLVGGIGVMNIMLVSVTERTREIGLKKAIGARKNIILGQFLTEAAVLTSLGGIIGTISGIILAEAIAKISSVPVAISIPAVVIAILFSMMIGIIFGFIPAVKAANLDPIVALRHE